jgi:hypothetical protein
MNYIWKKSTGNIIASLNVMLIVPITMIVLICLARVSINTPEVFPVLWYFLLAACIGICVATVMYCVNLGRFVKAQANEEDKRGARKIFSGALVLIIGNIIVGLINAALQSFAMMSLREYTYDSMYGYDMTDLYTPEYIFLFSYLPLILSTVVPLIGNIIMRDGFDKLSSSSTFNDICREGFTKLRQSTTISISLTIVTFALSIFSLIDFNMSISSMHTIMIVSGVIYLAILVIGIIGLVKLFSGWRKVHRNCPYVE